MQTVKRLLAASALLSALACRYDHRSLPNDGTDEDGGDTVGTDSDELPPGPPNAVIRLNTNGVLTVPLSGTALLNGSGSTAAEGAAIVAYAWSSDGCLSSLIPGDVASPSIFVEATQLPAGCVVTLTVTDDHGLSDSETATIAKRDVGGYVATSMCSDYDASATTAQGTVENPFCTVDDAIRVARAYAIADINIERSQSPQVFNISGSYDLPPVRYSGGFIRNGAEWTQGAGSVSAFVGQNNDDVNATVVRAIEPGPYTFSQLELKRSQRCTADCTYMEIRNATVTAANFRLFRMSMNAYDNPAPGRVIALDVQDGDIATTTLVGSLMTIGSDAAATSIALRATGNASVVLGSPQIFPGTGGALSIGVQARGAASVGIVGTYADTVSVVGQPASSSLVAYGIALGTTALLPGLDDCAECTGRPALSISGSGRVRTSNAATAFGIAAVGASSLNVRSPVLAEGGNAVGIRTLDVDGVSIANAEITARYTAGTTSLFPGAIGFYDGLDSPNTGTFQLGSTINTIAGGPTTPVTITGDSGEFDGTMERLAGAVFAASRGGIITGTRFLAQGNSSRTINASRLSGAVTYATRGMTFDGSIPGQPVSFNVENVNVAVSSVTAFLDGVPYIASAGSEDLVIDTATFDAQLKGMDASTYRACAAFNGTRGASRLYGGDVTCKADIGNAPSLIYKSIGVHTYATAGMRIEQPRVLFDGFVASPMPAVVAWAIGYLDGGMPDFSTLAGASDDLQINGMTVDVTNSRRSFNIGMWLRGGVSSQQARIFNSRIYVAGADSTDVGVVSTGTAMYFAYNTVRYGVCPSAPCLGSGVGIQLVETTGRIVDVIGNVFSAQRRQSSTTRAPMMLDLGGSGRGYRALHDNAWGADGTGAASETHNFYQTSARDSSQLIQSPSASDAAFTANDLLSADVFNNVTAVVRFCDGSHLAAVGTSSPLTNAIAVSTSDPYYSLLQTDGTGNGRVSMSWDAGANERVCAGL